MCYIIGIGEALLQTKKTYSRIRSIMYAPKMLTVRCTAIRQSISEIKQIFDLKFYYVYKEGVL